VEDIRTLDAAAILLAAHDGVIAYSSATAIYADGAEPLDFPAAQLLHGDGFVAVLREPLDQLVYKLIDGAWQQMSPIEPGARVAWDKRRALWLSVSPDSRVHFSADLATWTLAGTQPSPADGSIARRDLLPLSAGRILGRIDGRIDMVWSPDATGWFVHPSPPRSQIFSWSEMI
jgi:hypothetical protein